MSAGPSKELWAADPELAEALTSQAGQTLRVLDIEAKLKGAAQESHVSSERFVTLASRAARERRKLKDVGTRVQLARARALDARMCRLRGIRRPAFEPMPTVQLTLFPLFEPGPTPPRPAAENLLEACEPACPGELVAPTPPAAAPAAEAQTRESATELDELPQADPADVVEAEELENTCGGWCEHCRRRFLSVGWRRCLGAWACTRCHLEQCPRVARGSECADEADELPQADPSDVLEVAA